MNIWSLIKENLKKMKNPLNTVSPFFKSSPILQKARQGRFLRQGYNPYNIFQRLRGL